jgi:regulator of nonsense transcripts 1
VTRETLPRLVDRDNEEYANEIEIQTVDAYEGRDIDYVILMCVRSNDVHNIGFLNDTGRMNVALTRAKYGLFVVGNSSTLATNDHWEHFVSHCRDNAVIVTDIP